MCVRSRKAGIYVEEVIANSMLPLSNVLLDKLREDRYGKLEKLLTKFRDVKGSTTISYRWES
jgi:hypothetical protein